MKDNGLCELEVVNGQIVCRESLQHRIKDAVKAEAPDIICAAIGIGNPIASGVCVITHHSIKLAFYSLGRMTI
jgi:hypothetical protein